MNITAAELKKNFKLLSPVRSETYQIGDYGISSQDSDIWVVVPSPLSGLPTSLPSQPRPLYAQQPAPWGTIPPTNAPQNQSSLGSKPTRGY